MRTVENTTPWRARFCSHSCRLHRRSPGAPRDNSPRLPTPRLETLEIMVETRGRNDSSSHCGDAPIWKPIVKTSSAYSPSLRHGDEELAVRETWVRSLPRKVQRKYQNNRKWKWTQPCSECAYETSRLALVLKNVKADIECRDGRRVAYVCPECIRKSGYLRIKANNPLRSENVESSRMIRRVERSQVGSGAMSSSCDDSRLNLSKDRESIISDSEEVQNLATKFMCCFFGA